MIDNGGWSRREPLSREQWALVEPLLDAVLDLPEADRAAYCEQIVSSDPASGATLRRLLAHSDGDDVLDVAAEERDSLLFEDGAGVPDDADLVEQIRVCLGDTYALAREIGGGGMSRVFVADETALGRRVVIKVLRPELAAGLNADRFAREIKLAASLQQANIVPLLSAGKAAGLPFYTMPFVEGRSLRDRIRRDGALPIGDGVSILRDVARALAYAHAHGVVHRDIKPGNVLLSGGTAVVTDFGIAKALAAAIGSTRQDRDGTPGLGDVVPSDGVDLTITGAEASLGTPAYIAPEQAAGDPGADHRADLYSFGCLAYEVFVGEPPFDATTVQEVIRAHLRAVPRPVTERRPDVPAAIARLIAQCLEKNPARRPHGAADLLAALERGATQAATPPAAKTARASISRNRPAAVVTIAAAVLLVARAAYFAEQSPRDRPATSSPNDARTEWVLGNEALKLRGARVKTSVEHFERAIALDPNFAQAHAALATALQLRVYFAGTAPAELRDRTIKEARLALALDSTLSDAHAALGSVYAHAAMWDSSTIEFQRALALDPRNVTARLTYVRFLVERGKVKEGLAELETARKVERDWAVIAAWRSYALFATGQIDSALVENDRAIEQDPGLLPATNLGALMYLAVDSMAKARDLVAVTPPVGMMTNAPYVYAKLGDTVRANQLVHAMESATPRPWFTDVARASVFLAVGDSAVALTSIEESERMTGPAWVVFIPWIDPAFDLVRESPRFIASLRRAGIEPRRGASVRPGRQ